MEALWLHGYGFGFLGREDDAIHGKILARA
jgi:hypothetical protein